MSLPQDWNRQIRRICALSAYRAHLLHSNASHMTSTWVTLSVGQWAPLTERELGRLAAALENVCCYLTATSAAARLPTIAGASSSAQSGVFSLWPPNQRRNYVVLKFVHLSRNCIARRRSRLALKASAKIPKPIASRGCSGSGANFSDSAYWFGAHLQRKSRLAVHADIRLRGANQSDSVPQRRRGFACRSTSRRAHAIAMPCCGLRKS